MIVIQTKPKTELKSTLRLFWEGPYVGRASAQGISVFLEGRIDEIRGKKVAAADKAPDSLAQLVLEAYETGGIDQLKAAKGQFTIGLEIADIVYAMRTQFSLQPLYFTGEKASNQLINFKNGADTELDRDYFAKYLIQSRGLQWESPLSPLKGVSRLPPGYFLEIKGGKATTHCYDPLVEKIVWDEAQQISDIAPQLHKLINTIVNDSMESQPGPVGCELSGGLDSSYVNCIIADQRKKGHPAMMYTFSERPSHRYSEKCAEIVAKDKGIDLKLVPLEDIKIPDLKEMRIIRNEPNPMFWQGELFGSTLEGNFEENSILFTGFGSDSVLHHDTAVLAYLLKTGRWKKFFSTARGMGKTMERSPAHLMWQALIVAMPVRIRQFLRNAFSKLKLNPFSVEDVVPSAPGSTITPWMNRSISKYLDRRPVEFGKIDFSYLPYADAIMGPYVDKMQIKYVHPFCDSRLIRFAREKVSGHLIHDFDHPYKHLLRQAQLNCVPEEVRNRTHNEFYFDGFLRKVLAKNFPFLRQLLSEKLPVGEDFIDHAKMMTAFEQLQFGVGSHSTYYVTRVLSYVIWWRNFR